MDKIKKPSTKKLTTEAFTKKYLPALYAQEQEEKERNRPDYGKVLARRAMSSIQL